MQVPLVNLTNISTIDPKGAKRDQAGLPGDPRPTTPVRKKTPQLSGKKITLSPQSPLLKIKVANSQISFTDFLKMPISPVYEIDDEGFASDEATYHFTPEGELAKLLGKEPLAVDKIGQGDCWQVWKPRKFPDLVIKGINANINPRNRVAIVKDSLTALANYPLNNLVSLSVVDGQSPSSILQCFLELGAFVQPFAEPFTLAERTDLIPKVSQILKEIVTGNLPIQDFRPRNVGLLNGEISHFDPSAQNLENSLWTLRLAAYYQEWANEDLEILRQLTQPLTDLDHVLARTVLEKLQIK